MDYDKAIDALAERYGLVETCAGGRFPFEREARDEGRFGVSVVARAAGKDYGEVMADVKRRREAGNL